MSAETLTSPINLAALPAIGQSLADGTFGGVTTQPDGTHVAVVLLPGVAKDFTWHAAVDWAAKQGGVLPTRPIAAMLYANLRSLLATRWHWTSETHEDDASYAWCCDFSYGGQSSDHESYEGCAVAVRLIPLSA